MDSEATRKTAEVLEDLKEKLLKRISIARDLSPDTLLRRSRRLTSSWT